MACFDAEVTVPIRGAGDLAETDLVIEKLFCIIAGINYTKTDEFCKGGGEFVSPRCDAA